jgi:DNA-binding transcriptional regulator YdaS (Cro superfamily)
MRYASTNVCKTHNTMKLKDFLNELPRGQKGAFAAQVGIDPVYLSQIASEDQGDRKFRPSPALAVRIAKFSGQKVSRQELRPEDWQDIWPELVQAPANAADAANETAAQGA